MQVESASMSSGSSEVTKLVQRASLICAVIALSARRETTNSSSDAVGPEFWRNRRKARTLWQACSALASNSSKNRSSLPRSFCSETMQEQLARPAPPGDIKEVSDIPVREVDREPSRLALEFGRFELDSEIVSAGIAGVTTLRVQGRDLKRRHVSAHPRWGRAAVWTAAARRRFGCTVDRRERVETC